MGWSRAVRLGGGFLARLAGDTRANAIAIFAFALIPLCGMIGGGLDLSRMYVVKTRLQHACDAGALAGRKTMGGGTWAQQSYLPRTTAERFFDANIKSDIYGSNSITRSYSESAGKVSGTASAVVPMTLMRVLGKTTETLTVTCETEMRLPNTDVMFALDVTGSMNCRAGNANCPNGNNNEVPATDSKIDGLKVAVKCFYEIVARLDTDANCEAGAPSGGTGNQVQIRFGFVPFAVNANVGRLLPNNYLIDRGNYQTRKFVGDWEDNWTIVDTVNRNGQGNCNGVAPASTSDAQYRAVEVYQFFIFPKCRIDVRYRAIQWQYGSLQLNVSGLKAGGSSWRDSFQAQIGDNNTMATINWPGCVEERQTVQASNYDPIPSGAKDLDINLVPSVSDDSTRWRPSIPEAVYVRATTARGSTNGLSRDEVAKTATNYRRYVDYNNYYCPTPARALQTWPDVNAFDDYVDSLQARGNTYLDIGMIWAARLISPKGIFASTNAYTPQGGEIERHLIYMTDGDATSAPCDYNAYGMHYFERKQTNDVGNASECFQQRSSLANQINARLSAVCEAVKNENITLWVISFGGDLNQTTETRLENCASEGRYFKADDSAALQRTFKSIADQISALRLIK